MNCPAKPCGTMNYRGSTCSAQRAKYGLGDPMTNADRFRSLSDEDLADIIYELNMEGTYCQNRKECEKLLNNDGITDDMCKKCLLEYLRKPVEEAKLPNGICLDKEESGLTEDN